MPAHKGLPVCSVNWTIKIDKTALSWSTGVHRRMEEGTKYQLGNIVFLLREELSYRQQRAFKELWFTVIVLVPKHQEQYTK